MQARNKLRFQKRVLYRLKRDYGAPASVYRQIGEVLDRKTGKKTILKTYQHIERMIFLPGVEAQDFDYSSMGANFSRGGFFASTERIAVIDRSDLNTTFYTLQLNDYVIKSHERFQIKRLGTFEGGFAYWMVLDETANAPNYEVFDRDFKEKLRFSEHVTVTK